MMEFNDNKPIYKQIVEYAFNCIIDGMWPSGSRIPSVRELAGDLGVNTRTVLKAMEDLQGLAVIEPRRGMGFILKADAADTVRAERQREFFNVMIPALKSEMKRLGISTQELIKRISQDE